MSIRQISQTITGTTDFTNLKEEVTRNARELKTISLSNYALDTAPVVKVGSVFENNNVTFLVETGDETPTGYAGMTNSTAFYLYYDETAGAFIYLNTVPTWNDALQGYYNGNDRALFSMYKDSGGTLYQNKSLMVHQSSYGMNTVDGPRVLTKIIDIGDWDMDSTAILTVAHGLDWTKIRNVSVLIRDDDETRVISFISTTTLESSNQIIQVIGVNVSLSRPDDGLFDGVLYNATSFNRGWITITYVV